jgi:hypothetical protein
MWFWARAGPERKRCEPAIVLSAESRLDAGLDGSIWQQYPGSLLHLNQLRQQAEDRRTRGTAKG